MKITSITVQARDKDRVNVAVDGKYRFSLDVVQVTELGVRVGNEYSETEIESLEEESQFGKLYTRTLEYCLMRPHSQREVRDYLYKKTRDTRLKDGQVKKGVSPALTERVFERLVQKAYIDDVKFAKYWIENRNQRKGMSRRKLVGELVSKGVDRSIIDEALETSTRADEDELKKVIAKKHSRYDDDKKLIAYLAGQGFLYDDIKRALAEQSEG